MIFLCCIFKIQCTPTISKSHLSTAFPNGTNTVFVYFSHSSYFFPFLPAPGSLQATRALMIVGIIVSIAGLGVACMGMKCTTCGGNNKLRKSRVAMTGGIILLVGGEEAIVMFDDMQMDEN